MGLKQLLQPFPWQQYSMKLKKKIEEPFSASIITEADAKAANLRLAIGSAGSVNEGNNIVFFLLVSLDDGTIVDAKYQLYGETALIGAAEEIITLIVGKNYDQASRVSLDMLERSLRDKSDVPSAPETVLEHFMLAVEALSHATQQCMDIPLSGAYIAPPIPADMGDLVTGDGYPGFKELPIAQKIALIDHILSEDVRPFIEMDAGGVEVLSIQNEVEVLIAYQGACETCFSATGATLSFIQQVLRAKLDKDLIVVPNL